MRCVCCREFRQRCTWPLYYLTFSWLLLFIIRLLSAYLVWSVVLFLVFSLSLCLYLGAIRWWVLYLFVGVGVCSGVGCVCGGRLILISNYSCKVWPNFWYEKSKWHYFSARLVMFFFLTLAGCCSWFTWRTRVLILGRYRCHSQSTTRVKTLSHNRELHVSYDLASTLYDHSTSNDITMDSRTPVSCMIGSLH